MTEPETASELRERHLKELQGRNVAHYQVLLNAWIQTRMEHDKSLIAISSAGIGLLVTLAVLQGVREELELAAVIVGLVSFVLCILTSIRLYNLNSQVIASELTNVSDARPNLKPYDLAALLSFIIAITCFSGIGIAAIIHKFADYKGSAMSNSEKATVAPLFKKSLDGLQQLRPEAVQQPVTPAPTQPPTQPQQSGAGEKPK